MTTTGVNALRAQLLARFGRVPKVTKRKRALPRQQEPKSIQLSYLRELRGYLKVARAAVGRFLLPELTDLLDSRQDAWRADAGGKKTTELMDEARAAFADAVSDKDLETLARDIAEKTSDFQKEQLDKQVRATLGIDLATVDPDLSIIVDDFVASNVSLITSVSSKYFDAVETTVQAGIRAGTRHEDLATQIEDKFEASQTSAALIARDQTLKLFGEVNQSRQEELGGNTYIWRTSLDNRVRPEHAAREGLVFSWDDAPSGGHPGYDYNCRCTAELNLEEALSGL